MDNKEKHPIAPEEIFSPEANSPNAGLSDSKTIEDHTLDEVTAEKKENIEIEADESLSKEETVNQSSSASANEIEKAEEEANQEEITSDSEEQAEDSIINEESVVLAEEIISTEENTVESVSLNDAIVDEKPEDANKPEEVEINIIESAVEETAAKIDEASDLPAVNDEIATMATDDEKKEEEVAAGESETDISDNKETPFSKDKDKDTHENTDDDDEDDDDEGAVIQDNYQEFSIEQLVSAAEELVKAENINKIKTPLTLIKVEFLNRIKADKEKQLQALLDSGGQKADFQPEANPLEERFNDAFSIYREKRSEWNREMERKKLENLDLKKALLDELKELINSEEPLKKTYDQFNTLQEKWRQIGMVPKNEVNHLWENFHFLVDSFYSKVRMINELKDLDIRKNLEIKLELCGKAEELLLEQSITKSFKQLQALHEEWRNLGPVPTEYKEEIWERFKDASNKINERRREYFEKLHLEQENNLMAKNALCEKVIEVLQKEPQNFKDWQSFTNEINECVKFWKTLGPAPKKHNDEVWERFRSLVNDFFNNKQEFFNKVKDEQNNNYNLKVSLCVSAEDMKDSTDWRKTTGEFLKLQEEWKKIGAVPRKLSDKIWKRFRAACDAFFKAKAEYFANINSIEDENLKKKEEMLENIKNQAFTDNKQENLKIIKKLQRDWMEIGHVPGAQKNRLNNEFRNIINTHLDKLKISAAEISAQNYKARLDNIKDSPDSARMLSKEKAQIMGKINGLKSEINLWENNLGYFANSKQADLLKQEFEKKIQKAKEEVALLEAKIKFIEAAR